MSTEPARSEAMRSKLNRLAERGWLRKLADGKLTTTLRTCPAIHNMPFGL